VKRIVLDHGVKMNGQLLDLGLKRASWKMRDYTLLRDVKIQAVAMGSG
jgi:hypothetical protein